MKLTKLAKLTTLGLLGLGVTVSPAQISVEVGSFTIPVYLVPIEDLLDCIAEEPVCEDYNQILADVGWGLRAGGKIQLQPGDPKAEINSLAFCLLQIPLDFTCMAITQEELWLAF